MPQFTDQQIITYEKTSESVSLVTNHGTNGELAIEASSGDGWILVDTITTTGAVEYFVKGRTFRFTPSDGMIYDIDSRE